MILPPSPGNRYINEILNTDVNNKMFFSKKDSLNIMAQSLNSQKIEIDKIILDKLNSTTFEKEMIKLKNGKQYNFYEMKVPVFSLDNQKAYVELDYRCGGLCGGGKAIFLEKIKGKWKIVEKRTTWIS